MKIQSLFIFLLISLSFCVEPNNDSLNIIYIVFSNEEIKIPEGGATISGTSVIIEKSGIYLITGESEEGNIVIKANSVILYLQNLKLSSKKTAPIIVTSNLKDIKIINLENSILKDLEDPYTTEGECAVVKIKKNSSIYFRNNDILKLSGECKNIIRGGSQVSITFEKSEGEYIINSYKTAISSDGLLEFNGGIFTIISEYGDAIKSSPEDLDSDSLGKIIINDGTFNIQCFNDAFTAKNNITIVNGKFDIKTENGYDSETYNETESSKGFKLTSDIIGSEIKIYSGEFYLNTADDAIRSNRDIKILTGKFTIYSKDDAICAKYNLELGKRNSPLDELNIKILSSYEALEGMTITIYSGKIIATSENDGINASGVIKKQQNRTRRYRNNTNETEIHSWNDTERRARRNRTQNNTSNTGEKRKHIGTPGNNSYTISIFDGEIYVFSESDGIDTNGNVYIHGGNINIFSKGSGTDEPIDHNGNFTLFNAEILGVGSEGIESVHEGIKKGNQMYAFYSGFITKDKILEIKNEKDEVIKEGSITTDINYIFYTSEKINEDYKFFIYDEKYGNKTELNITFGYPENGLDDEDVNYFDYEEKKNNENSQINESNSKGSFLNNIKSSILMIIILILF